MADYWSDEEVEILLNYFNNTRDEIQDELSRHGFTRSTESIKKKKTWLRKAGEVDPNEDVYVNHASTDNKYASYPEALSNGKAIVVDTPYTEIPHGFHVKGISTNYDGEGNIKQQWVRTDQDKQDTLDQLKEAVDMLIEPCRGLSPSIKKPKITHDDLMAAYPIADVHLGLFSWRDETGTDYDMKICEKILNDSMTELVESAPATRVCLIANLADFFHADTIENKTMRAGNVLDVDSRWGKIIQVGVRAYRNIINIALQKHEKVIVKSAVGNHDDHSSMWLAMLMKAYYENNDRVDIELPISHFSYHVFGDNLIGITHGGIKSDRLPGIMATDKAKDWGKTTYRTFWSGHIHHKEVKEHPGCLVETFRAVTAPDAWTHKAGYRSTRSMECLIFKKDGGEHGRRIVNIK